MNKIKNIYISYWFKEINYNPSIHVDELENEIKSIIDAPIMYNDDKLLNNISFPRIQGISHDKKYFFTMSLVNAFLSININEDITIDEAILLINNNIQLFYDVLKNVFDIKILYSSIKIELVDESKKAKDKLIKLLNLSDNNYEDLSFKRGIIKDEYYINYILTYTKEYNFNVERQNNTTEQDLFDRSMITSLSEASITKDFLLTIIEINDRYSYNLNKDYESSKDAIRGMIIEIKDILNKELYDRM